MCTLLSRLKNPCRREGSKSIKPEAMEDYNKTSSSRQDIAAALMKLQQPA